MSSLVAFLRRSNSTSSSSSGQITRVIRTARKHRITTSHLVSVRCLSTTARLTTRPDEEVQVKCGANGNISLQLFNTAPTGHPPAVILYLPSGIHVTTPANVERTINRDFETQDDAILHRIIASAKALANARQGHPGAGASVVRVNYRIGKSLTSESAFTFPTPVHDVLAGYDWVRENLCHSSSSSPLSPSLLPNSDSDRGKGGRSGKIGVCGQLLGGGLAMMLGLTESRLGDSGISAVMAHEPVLNWTFDRSDQSGRKVPKKRNKTVGIDYADIDTPAALAAAMSAPARKTGGRRSSVRNKAEKQLPSWQRNANSSYPSTEALLKARESFFRKPEGWFDPFASPLLFFRTAGVEVPQDTSSEGSLLDDRHMMPWTALGDSDEPVDAFEDMPAKEAYASSESPDADDPSASESSRLERDMTSARISHRAFPPSGSALRLPFALISSSPDSVLHDQATEMVALMRRSWLRSAVRTARMGDELEQDLEVVRSVAEREAERRFVLGHGIQTAEKHTGLLWGVGESETWESNVDARIKWLTRHI